MYNMYNLCQHCFRSIRTPSVKRKFKKIYNFRRKDIQSLSSGNSSPPSSGNLSLQVQSTPGNSLLKFSTCINTHANTHTHTHSHVSRRGYVDGFLNTLWRGTEDGHHCLYAPYTNHTLHGKETLEGKSGFILYMQIISPLLSGVQLVYTDTRAQPPYATRDGRELGYQLVLCTLVVVYGGVLLFRCVFFLHFL